MERHTNAILQESEEKDAIIKSLKRENEELRKEKEVKDELIEVLRNEREVRERKMSEPQPKNVTLGAQNRIWANAPPGSRPQFNILINGEKTTGKSGWHVWQEDGNWYHLGGGCGDNKREPTIYKLTSKGGWTTKDVDQSKAKEYYEQYGKII